MTISRPWDAPGLPDKPDAEDGPAPRCDNHSYCSYRDDDPARCPQCHMLVSVCSGTHRISGDIKLPDSPEDLLALLENLAALEPGVPLKRTQLEERLRGNANLSDKAMRDVIKAARDDGTIAHNGERGQKSRYLRVAHA